MINLLLGWLASALSLLIVAYFVPGFRVNSFVTALIAAVVIGLVNGTLGFVVRLLTFPLRLLTLGLLSLVINAVMLWIASYFVDGFHIDSFVTALIGSICLSIVNWLLRLVLHKSDKKD
ncbi:MAG: phage holin family protein [Bryobacteraceae bacterium]|nr:phage holin family protein [Bryobacteraceae bacterium]